MIITCKCYGRFVPMNNFHELPGSILVLTMKLKRPTLPSVRTFAIKVHHLFKKHPIYAYGIDLIL